MCANFLNVSPLSLKARELNDSFGMGSKGPPSGKKSVWFQTHCFTSIFDMPDAGDYWKRIYRFTNMQGS